jgi:hypothetical protein
VDRQHFHCRQRGSLHAESRGPGLGTTMSMRLPTISAETPELLEALDG